MLNVYLYKRDAIKNSILINFKLQNYKIFLKILNLIEMIKNTRVIN